MSLAKKICLYALVVYQKALSPFFGNCCRFYPSCSQYCIESLEHHGVILGLWKSIKRIVKCGPWHAGGYDPVRAKKD